MSWSKKILKVLGECEDSKGVLKAKWEIVQTCKDDSEQKMPPELVKTGYYMKDGALTRGFPQGANKYDLAWIIENKAEIDSLLGSISGVKRPGITSKAEAAPVDADHIEAEPF